MSPKQFKEIREKLGLTQTQLADCLGLTQKAVSHYETGFRKPGTTVQVIMTAFEMLPDSQAKKLLAMMGEIAESLARKKAKRRRT